MEKKKKYSLIKYRLDSLRGYFTSYNGEDAERIRKLKKRYSDMEILSLFEKDIIKENNPNLSFNFLVNVKGANIKEHSKVILASDNAIDVYRLCHSYKSIAEFNGMDETEIPNFKVFENRILEIGNVKKCFEFALEFDEADWQAHKDIIVKNGSLEDLIIFMAKLYAKRKEKHLDNVDFSRYMKMAIDNKCTEACCSYIVSGVEDEKMHDELVKTIILFGDEYSVYWCQPVARDWQLIGDYVASTSDEYKNFNYINAPISLNKDLDIKKNEQVITASGNLTLNYQLLANAYDDVMPISNINVQEHKDVIFDNNSLKGLYYKILYKTKVEPKEKKMVKIKGK